MKSSKMSFLKVCITLLLSVAGLLSLTNCKQTKKPSFIMIAADQLALNSYLCGDEKETNISGLNILCKESIRFTNAFTTSTQTAAAMGSLLSGTYPFQHKLHRSFDRISADKKMLQEYFKEQNYRTSFWSGKATILKKTGLAKGFDLFDDYTFLNQSKFSVSFDQQGKQFLNWALESSKPFFSTIYTSAAETLNEGQTEISSLEVFDEQLGQFFNHLKENSLWDSSYIILVGLQGKSDYNRPNESIFSNLHTENTNIALFIKPPRDKGDEGVSWKSNAYITLADFGFSLIKTITPEQGSLTKNGFKIIDHSHFWKNNKVELSATEQRKILIEAANTWKKPLELRFAVIDNNYLYIESEKDELYNKLTDGLETIDLSHVEKIELQSQLTAIAELRNTIAAKKWTNYQPEIYDFVLTNRDYWSKPNSRGEVFQKEKLRLLKSKKTQPLSTLLAYYENSKLAKDETYDIARLNSYNLSLENIWGLWDDEKKWNHPELTIENQ